MSTLGARSGDRPGAAERRGGEAHVFRAPMRARSVDAGRFAGATHAVERSLIGTGEPLSRVPADLDEAVLAAIDELGEKSGRMLARFADLPDSSLVWTQTAEDEFRLGRIAGPWRYDESLPARRTGIHQVRPARWLPERFDPGSTPAGVIEVFRRGGLNLQRIHDPEAERASNRLWRTGDDGGREDHA